MSVQETYLRGIADAIREKEGTSEAIPANTFADRVRAIPSGPRPGTPLDPGEVYKATRPTDWLTMPEPGDDEMYLLFHIPDGVSALLAFTVTCTGSYTVQFGTVRDGAFAESLTVTRQTVPTGVKLETELFAGDFGDLTSDDMKQVMIRVSGTDILTWEPSAHSRKPLPNDFNGWNIVEIVCRLPKGTKVRCGNPSSSEYMSLRMLRYFAWVGKNAATEMKDMFYDCYSLITVPALDTSSVTSMMNMFSDCYSLIAIPAMDTRAVTTMMQMFYDCRALPAIPALDTSAATNTMNMFSYCWSLTAAPKLDTHTVKDMMNMFYDCRSLTVVPELDTSAATDMKNTFFNCYSLGSLRFRQDVAGWAGHDITLNSCSLCHDALVALFESLPKITTSKKIFLYDNPGLSEVTDAEKAVATGKNWTLLM